MSAVKMVAYTTYLIKVNLKKLGWSKKDLHIISAILTKVISHKSHTKHMFIELQVNIT